MLLSIFYHLICAVSRIGSHVDVGISLLYLCFYSLSLSQFQSIFVSFVAIPAAVYGPMSLFQGHVLPVEESGQNSD